MTQVTIPPSLGGSGVSYSDDGTGARDMRNGGHRAWLLPMVGEQIAAAQAAATAAASTLGSANTQATSTTSLAIGTGARSLVVEPGKAFVVGMPVRIASAASPANRMDGTVTSYDSGTGALDVAVERVSGSGTLASWRVFLTGAAAAAGIPRSARTSNTQIGQGDFGAWIDITSGAFTQTFDAPGGLGTGWFCYVSNTGSGVVTIPESDGQMNWSFWPGEFRLFHSDGAALRSIALNAVSVAVTVSGNIVVPPGFHLVDYLLAGGAGGGGGGGKGGGTNQGASCGGGGSGAPGGTGRFRRRKRLVTAGETLTATIGAGATGGAGGTGTAAADGVPGQNGNGGSSTSFDSVTASGGAGGGGGGAGIAQSGGAIGGAGGSAANVPGDTGSGANRLIYSSVVFANPAGVSGAAGSGAAGAGGVAPAVDTLTIGLGVTYAGGAGGNGGNGGVGSNVTGQNGGSGTAGSNGFVFCTFIP